VPGQCPRKGCDSLSSSLYFIKSHKKEGREIRETKLSRRERKINNISEEERRSVEASSYDNL
jgi:hypothetical protein